MNEKKGVIAASAGILRSHKRYVAWLYLLNLVFAWWSAGAFAASAHRIMDKSLYSDQILHQMDVGALGEFFIRPESGMPGSGASATNFAALYFLATLFFMPGVLLGFASDHRISRAEFYRTCGHNLWRFVRLLVMYAMVGGIVAGILFGIHMGLSKAVDQAANDDRIVTFVRLGTLLIVFLGMTIVRAWFDVAQTDVVVRDQSATRKSVAAAWRMVWHNFGRVFGSYLLIAIIGIVILLAGIWLWHVIVPPASVVGAFLVSQVMLLLLLAVRFWQRAAAVAFHERSVSEPETKPEASTFAATAVV